MFASPIPMMEIVKSLQEINHQREFFVSRGRSFTEGYLSAFTGIRKILAEWWVWGDCPKYHGAKDALNFFEG